jgi:hypothetical protein
MEMKVTRADDEGGQSRAEREQELIEQHEAEKQEVQQEAQEVEPTSEPEAEPGSPNISYDEDGDMMVKFGDAAVEDVEDTEESTQVEDSAEKNTEASSEPDEDQISDEAFFEYYKQKTGRDVSSFEDMVEVREQEVDLPEDVKAILDYKEKTGRSISDYMKYTQDFTSMPDNDIIAMHLKEQFPELDAEDIEFKMNRDFGFDEDLDDDVDIRQKRLDKKIAAKKAREHFDSQKGQYEIPLESRSYPVPEEEKERYARFKQYEEAQADSSKTAEEVRKSFVNKTNELFSDKFEGFKFKVGDEEFTHKVGDTKSISEKQSDINNFIRMHFDENGQVKDAAAYHKAIYLAMNGEQVLNSIWETAQAKALEEDAKRSKNIDMEVNRTGAAKGRNASIKMSKVDDGSRKGAVINLGKRKR